MFRILILLGLLLIYNRAQPLLIGDNEDYTMEFSLFPGVWLGYDYLLKINLSPCMTVNNLHNNITFSTFVQPELSLDDFNANAGFVVSMPNTSGPTRVHDPNDLITIIYDEYLIRCGAKFGVKFRKCFINGIGPDNLYYNIQALFTVLMLNFETGIYFNGTNVGFNAGIGIGY